MFFDCWNLASSFLKLWVFDILDVVLILDALLLLDVLVFNVKVVFQVSDDVFMVPLVAGVGLDSIWILGNDFELMGPRQWLQLLL
jgi:hypothetical protein